MDIIVTHINADFDAAASMIAAAKLYPGAHLGLSGSLNRNVREFFTLYLRQVRLLRAREIELARITRLIVVDTQDISRLGRFSEVASRPSVEKIFFDHHPIPRGARGDASEKRFTRKLGSTVTLLARELLKRKMPISPIEATLFCTAIYEDTGCLLFGSTTPTDVRTVFDLTRFGADLSIISMFVGRGLNHEQRILLEQLMKSMKVYRLQGFEVGLGLASCRTYLEDLDAVVAKLREIQDLGILFVAVGMGRHTYLIGRSRFSEVPAGDVLAELGGGGHPYAASAVLHNVPPQAAGARLLDVLKKRIRPQSTAAQIMTSPVKTVSATAAIADARMIMSGFGYGSLPVMDGTRLVGIATRADMEKAVRHGLGHARVTGYMTRDPYVISPDTPLLDIHQLMIERNVSSLPVVEKDAMVGIVTAQDVLRCLHRSLNQERRPQRTGRPAGPVHCRTLLEQSLSADRFRLLCQVGEVGDELGLKSYLIGGTVRDVLLSRRNMDLDIVVEQDAHLLARTIHERFGGRIQLYERYRTATLSIQGIRLDLATTRREFYEFPAAPPQVDTQNVRLDLFRRDFTINAMALSLSRGNLGDLFDYYGGYRDLLERKVRVLHNLSFVEDPTRIFRAVRFSGRLRFDLEPRTSALMSEALTTGMLDKLGREVVFSELSNCLKERDACRVVTLLMRFEVLKGLAASLHPTEETLDRVARVEAVEREFESSIGPLKDRCYPYFCALLLDSPLKREVSTARFLVPKKYQEWANALESDLELFAKSSDAEVIHLIRSCYPPPRILLIAALSEADTGLRIRSALHQAGISRRSTVVS